MALYKFIIIIIIIDLTIRFLNRTASCDCKLRKIQYTAGRVEQALPACDVTTSKVLWNLSSLILLQLATEN